MENPSRIQDRNGQSPDCGWPSGMPLYRFSDAHDLAYGASSACPACPHAFEFFKRPACKFNYNIIAGRNVFIQSAAFTARNLIQSKAGCQHRGYQAQSGNPVALEASAEEREVLGLISMTMSLSVLGSWAHCTLVPPITSIGIYDFVWIFPKRFWTSSENGKHRCGAEGITGMYAEGIDVFNEADGDHVVFTVSYNFQLQFFPAENGFFHENLTYHTGLKASCRRF